MGVLVAELGSLGSVVLGQLDNSLEHGITTKALKAVEGAGRDAHTVTLDAELEDRRADKVALQKGIASAGARLERSRKVSRSTRSRSRAWSRSGRGSRV